ncbi:putative polysaccharide biosynthesis protein [Alkalibacter saccharofermentans]|uniref:Stage V sporulation protein B n=1 Tax=Alkalibacter saccharofermentans DSM 14828 TaxID=1120975 RepID=A0A1M4YD03_9FIRM|nr:polysaccharide biosynthesis protein [Alkalibacter saccharofermentans]SHF03579.1 stage V sporulation protein B [Alkalibacter saccharofermentans DSM 14828]
MSRSSYIRGAGIIAIGGIIAKLLGLFFKIPIGRILDSFGYGLYYNSYNIYNLMLTISIIGVPVAISKMIAERASVKNYLGVMNVFKISMLFMLIVGSVASLTLFLGANFIIKIAGWDEGTYYALLGLAFAPFFVSLLSGFRGFFQGMQMMTPTAISQIIEAFARVLLGIGLCIYLTNNFGYAEGAGGASSGALFGAVAAFLFLIFAWYLFIKDFRKKVEKSSGRFAKESNRKLVKRLLQIAIPVTLTSAVVSLFGIVNSFTYVSRLAKAGFDLRQATMMFGDYGLAQTMINVPLTFSTAMSITLVPSISESFVLKNKAAIKHKTELGLRMILLIALPCAVGLSVFSEEIFALLFPNSAFGGGILNYFAFSTVLIMFANTLQSILQGMDKFTLPLKHLIPGLFVNLVFNFIFVSIPEINIYGLVISNMSAYFVIGALNYKSVRKYTNVRINPVQTVLKPVAASAFMGFFGILAYDFLNNWLNNAFSVLISIFLCIIIYMVSLISIKGLTEEELEMFPGRNRLRKFLGKLVRKG